MSDIVMVVGALPRHHPERVRSPPGGAGGPDAAR